MTSISSITARILNTPLGLWPTPTPVALDYEDAKNPFSPKPTGSFQLLQQRAVNSAQCGLYQGQPVTCSPGYVCASNSAHSAAGCCPATALQDCIIPSTCVNSASMSTYCGSDCLVNDYVLKCTNPSYPYCFAQIWNYYPQVTDWNCAATNTYITIDPNSQITSTAQNTAFATAHASSAYPSASGSGSGSDNGANDTNDCGNQIDGNLVYGGGSISVEGSGGDSCGSEGSSNGGSGSSGGGGGGGSSSSSVGVKSSSTAPVSQSTTLSGVTGNGSSKPNSAAAMHQQMHTSLMYSLLAVLGTWLMMFGGCGA